MIGRDEVVGLYRRHVNATLAKLANLMGTHLEVRSEGCLVTDERGTSYLDCGGYGVFLLGHRHPAVVAAVREQLDRHPMASRIMLSPELAVAAAELARVAPRGLTHVFFTNSGAEAVEAGLKLARLAGRRTVISTDGGFHGKTLGALSVTGRARYRDPFEPLLPGVEFVEFGNAGALEAALDRHGRGACVILEPVQGEGGVVVPPPGYLRRARELTTACGAVLLLDEVQTGLGRLGSWWGADREDVVPDAVLAGKALGGGVVPAGAVIASDELFAPLDLDPLLHTSTFGGNPLAAAAVTATVLAIEAEGMVDTARELGGSLLGTLASSVRPTPDGLVTDVRGAGLLIGVELAEEYLAADLMQELLTRNVLVSYSINAQRVVRITPPAVIAPSEVDWLLQAVDDSVAALRARYGRRAGAVR